MQTTLVVQIRCLINLSAERFSTTNDISVEVVSMLFDSPPARMAHHSEQNLTVDDDR
jgi:hypothetical protein